jgi:hypothetical protein
MTFRHTNKRVRSPLLYNIDRTIARYELTAQARAIEGFAVAKAQRVLPLSTTSAGISPRSSMSSGHIADGFVRPIFIAWWEKWRRS